MTPEELIDKQMAEHDDALAATERQAIAIRGAKQGLELLKKAIADEKAKQAEPTPATSEADAPPTS